MGYLGNQSIPLTPEEELILAQVVELGTPGQHLAVNQSGTGVEYVDYYLVTNVFSDIVFSDLFGDFLIICDCSNNPINITLPDPTVSKARYNITKIDNSINKINILGLINGVLNTSINFKNTTLDFISSGPDWKII